MEGYMKKFAKVIEEKGILAAIKYDAKETMKRGNVERIARCAFMGLAAGLTADVAYSGIESMIKNKPLIETFLYSYSAFKAGFIGGTIGGLVIGAWKHPNLFNSGYC
ncbi:MAG: hypothetical protein V1660_02020 [archaeon]